MGLRDTMRKAASAGFKVAGNVRKTCRYIHNVSTTHNISAGTVSTIARSYAISMIFETYSQTEIRDSHVEPTDVKAFIPQTDLIPVPSNRDLVINADEVYGSTEYTIVGIGTDPADALWVFQLRAIGKGQS